MAEQEYSPLGLSELAESVVRALLRQAPQPLPPATEFEGCGLYAIYYEGRFELYTNVAGENRVMPCSWPIYVGKAVPTGGRKGWAEGEPRPQGSFLYRRLREHAESVNQAANLRGADFQCRYLVTDPVWIPLGERLLIQRFRPVWNIVVDGFGNHDPGEGRRAQRRSAWDEIHPGRPWCRKLAPNKKGAEEAIQRLRAMLEAAARA